MRLSKDAYPLAPVLTSAAENKPIKAKITPNMPAQQNSKAAKPQKATKAKAQTYQGVQIFPIAPKKKAPAAKAEEPTKAQADAKASASANSGGTQAATKPAK